MEWSVQAESSTRVKGWSEVRLPFEPKGDALEYKKALRLAVSGLVVPPGHGLRASLRSDDRSPADAENVLLYNVGASPFKASASSDWLLIERDFSADHDHPRHFVHRYEVLKAPHSTCWRVGETGALVTYDAPATLSVAEFWLSARRVVLAGRPGPDCSEGPLWLELTTPWSDANLADRVKKLVDGVISALHFDPSPDADSIERLGNVLGLGTAEVYRLMAAPVGPLGARRILWKFGASGIQWNPDDGRLVVILVRRGVDLPFAFRLSTALPR